MMSIVIPTLNEEENIAMLISYLQKCCAGKRTEIIIVDGGSTDRTRERAASLDVKVIESAQKSRAIQMNMGATVAQFDIIYFIHADSIPPQTFYTDIISAVKNGYAIGRYRTKFKGNKFLLKFNAFFTRFDWFVCYGGDQTLFITANLFNKINGYDESLLIMEEYDFVQRAKQLALYKIFSDTALVSIRKYDSIPWLKVQIANYKIVQLYKKGIPQKELVEKYQQSLKT